MKGARLAAVVSAAVLAGGMMAACGGSTTSSRPSASALAEDMKTAVKSSSSVHISGTVVEAGRRIGLNIDTFRSGQAAGTVIQQGRPLQFVSVGGKAYVKATRGFLASLHLPAVVCTAICGKYIQLPASRAGEFTSSFSLAALTGPLVNRTPSVHNQGTTSVNGKPAYVLRSAKGGTLAVAKSHPHYPLSLTSPAGRQGSLTFSHWNSAPVPKAPPKDQVVSSGHL